MTNLYHETEREMTQLGYAPEDVVYIGSRDGHSCTWEEFVALADIDYDSGYGGQEVASDLEVHFRDGAWLYRSEYDGSEWWDVARPLTPPAERLPVRRLVRGLGYGGRLAEIQGDEDA